MVAAAFFAFERAPNLASQTVAIALVGVTAGCALAAALGMANVVPAFRHTFYRHRTIATHVREYWWNREPYMYNGEMQEQEKIRAESLTSFARCYWPMDLVEPFVRDNWYAARTRRGKRAAVKERFLTACTMSCAQVKMGAREAVLV